MSTKNIIPLIDDSSVSSVNSWSSTKIQAAINENVPDIDLSGKMDSANPTGTGSFSLNRDTNSVVGDYSFAEGYFTIASGRASHAEGNMSMSVGKFAHAEGQSNSMGNSSHSEGMSTANGDFSHAEGYGTSAYGANQHVQGTYNINDYNEKYAHIVGNGYFDDVNAEEVRSNAHTLDWDGNAEFAGDVIIYGCGGENPISVSSLATSETVTEEEIHSLFVEIGAFTFNGNNYQFEIGMTWAEFVASDYNTAGLAITGSSLSYGSSTVMYNGSYNGTYATDTIMSGATYAISNEPA